MSQQQPQEPQEAIKYGDVFRVEGELADKPVAPRDAAMMESADNEILGRIPKGGAASVMQSAAAGNERAGVVAHTDVTDVVRDQGVNVIEVDISGKPIIAEAVAGQVVAAEEKPVVSTHVAASILP